MPIIISLATRKLPVKNLYGKNHFPIHKKSPAYTGDFLFPDINQSITFLGHGNRQDNPA